MLTVKHTSSGMPKASYKDGDIRDVTSNELKTVNVITFCLKIL